MTRIALLRTTGWLYAGLCALSAIALLADALLGVGETRRLGLGVVLLVIPFALFSFLLLRAGNRERSKYDLTLTLCLLAVLYFLVHRIYGFFYWYATGNASLLMTWASLPIVWLEATACVAVGIALWTRRELASWFALCLGSVALFQAVATLPDVVNSYPSVRHSWPDIAPQVFKVSWLVLFVVLVLTQLLERNERVPQAG